MASRAINKQYNPLFSDPALLNRNTLSKKLRDICCVIVTLILISIICVPIAYVLSTVFMLFYDTEGKIIDSLTTTVPPVTSRSTTQIPITTTKNPNIPAASCRKRVIGYYTEWEKAEVSEKQLKKLTHVIYLFVNVQENGTIKFDSDRAENRFLDMKNKAMTLNSGLKMMIGVGGHANSVVFSPLMKDVGKRKTLIDSIASFTDENDLDGVDIFWVWSNSDDKLHHSKFIRELRKRLNDLKSAKRRNEEYLISVIVPPSVSHLDSGYYLNEIMKHVDFLNVLTYDYYFNGNRVGPHSPIYGGTRGNIDETMKYLACKTKKPNKLNMAVPFYGTFWINASLPLHDDSDDIWKEKGDARGPYAVRWNQLDSEKWDKSSARFHEKSKTSYIWIPETKHFLTFENEKSLGEKTKYVKEKDLGGMLIWAIDQDDEENTLLNVVSSADVCSETEKKSVEYNCNN
ncbi:hypothetical protein CRE_01641 [Caenorhabditis remanei]|uniref:GH18 domain-containing protein n=1 Tax=Caenorhabditis remanei TaxID=31234 RepID=E3LGY0_CAERE|nr:hypothetical protein CRE_01641 [Caenorhabditis remanei]